MKICGLRRWTMSTQTTEKHINDHMCNTAWEQQFSLNCDSQTSTHPVPDSWELLSHNMPIHLYNTVQHPSAVSALVTWPLSKRIYSKSPLTWWQIFVSHSLLWKYLWKILVVSKPEVASCFCLTQTCLSALWQLVELTPGLLQNFFLADKLGYLCVLWKLQQSLIPGNANGNSNQHQPNCGFLTFKSPFI